MNSHTGAFRSVVRENHICDALRDGLNQVDRVTLDRCNDFEGELAVVDGLGEFVARSRGREIEPHSDIHYKNLTVATLMIEDAVKGVGA